MFIHLIWEPGASPDYMADVIAMKWSKPTVRGPSLRLEGGKPSFILTKVKEVSRGFDGGSPRHNSKAKTLELVLMDGSFTCFAARLNSSLMPKLFGHSTMPLGTKVTVLDHEFIWMWNEKLLETRTVMFIKDFKWL